MKQTLSPDGKKELRELEDYCQLKCPPPQQVKCLGCKFGERIDVLTRQKEN